MIRLKVAALLDQLHAAEEERDKWRLEAETLREALQNQTNTIQNLEERNKILKLADGIQLNQQEKAGMRQAINRYLLELDECLKLLNQLPNNN